MKREHILAVLSESISVERNTLTSLDSLSIDPQMVVVGHRERLDKLNGTGDRNFLQPIGYAVITHPDKGLLAYRRQGSEGRLDGKISIGFGGHTSVTDIVVFDGTEEIDFLSSTILGMERELAEELHFIKNGQACEAVLSDFENHAPVGVISCDRTDVDLLHIGLVYSFELDKAITEVSLGDHGQDIFWIKDVSEIELDDCEEWTKIILEEHRF